jgi:phage shock protein A
MNRISTVVKQKVSTLLDKYENPKEALDYSYTKQTEMLNKLRRDIAEVITAKKRLEMQKAKLWDNIRTLDEQSRRAIDADREDLARLALERKNANMLRLRALDKQITDMQAEQEKLQDTERRLSSKVEEFNSKKEVIKAQYSAAEAEVRIKESVTGISEEMADVGIAMNKAEEKTEKMKAKSQALDEMIDSGVLTDYTTSPSEDGGSIEKELEDVVSQESVDQELAKLKAERSKKKRIANKSDDSEEEEEEGQAEEIQQSVT